MIECQTKPAKIDAMPPLRRSPDRRREDRKRLVYRLVHIEHEGDQGLARCRNISEAGMKLEITMSMTVGTAVKIAFSASHAFSGTVIWAGDGYCGIGFDEPLDYDTVLRLSAVETRKRGFPELRVSGGLNAVLTCDGHARPTRVSELTQHGLKLIHDGRIRSGDLVTVRFRLGKPRHGIVRWSRGTSAELVLIEPFSVGDLGSMAALDALSAGASRVWAA
jgi:hypothetical protein